MPVVSCTRLKVEAAYVKVGGKSVPELVDMSVSELEDFFVNLELTPIQQQIAERILPDIRNLPGIFAGSRTWIPDFEPLIFIFVRRRITTYQFSNFSGIGFGRVSLHFR